MLMKRSALAFALGFSLVVPAPGSSEPVARISSPNGSLQLEASLDASGSPTYSVSFRGKAIVVDPPGSHPP
jgi:hypothetical protein